MTREECEAKILEKLKEIREIVKQYDNSHVGYLDMNISNEKDYISVFNCSSAFGIMNTAIDFTVMNGKVYHLDN